MYILVLLFPILSFLLLIFGGYKLSKKYLLLTNCSLICLSYLCAFFIFIEIFLFQSKCNIETIFWINLLQFQLKWIFFYDNLTSIMLILVLTVSLLVHIYSLEYMETDPYLIRFMSYLSLFTFFMLILITAGSYIQLFVGWEGVGLSSYLLVNFWYTRIQANKAALKAIILNRFGDVGLYLSILILFYCFHTSDFNIINDLLLYPFRFTYSIIDNYLFYFDFFFSFAGFFILIGAIGKSAQLGLHTWLPDATEGPTPVSALIHAATMVTAGVFLLLRSIILLEYNSNVQLCIILIGALTAFFAGSVGCLQFDLKKVIAYSTCSQLGYMVFCCGISNIMGSLFHLYTHGFFKALLFLGAGSIIHSLYDEQDLRRMGGLQQLLPLAYLAIFIGSCSLIGLPGLSGFYSKDVIIETGFIRMNSFIFFCHLIILCSILFSTIYSFRLLYLTFLNFPNLILHSKLIHESKQLISIVLIILIICSINIGFLFKELFFCEGFWLFWISLQALINTSDFLFNSEFIIIIFKLFPLILIFGGLFWYLDSIIYYQSQFYTFNSRFFLMAYFLNYKWYFDLLYNNFFVIPLMNVAYKIPFKLIDRGIIEQFGSLGVSLLLLKINFHFLSIKSGYIYHYIFCILISLLFLLFLIYILNFSIFTFCFFAIIFIFWLI